MLLAIWNSQNDWLKKVMVPKLSTNLPSVAEIDDSGKMVISGNGQVIIECDEKGISARERTEKGLGTLKLGTEHGHDISSL